MRILQFLIMLDSIGFYHLLVWHLLIQADLLLTLFVVLNKFLVIIGVQNGTQTIWVWVAGPLLQIQLMTVLYVLFCILIGQLQFDLSRKLGIQGLESICLVDLFLDCVDFFFQAWFVFDLCLVKDNATTCCECPSLVIFGKIWAQVLLLLLN